MFRVPLPIAQLELETIPDEAGFTETEKLALRNAWKFLSSRLDDLAIENFLDFFSEYETLINAFRDENGDIKMYEFHMHPYNIFYFMTRMIFNGLKSLPNMNTMLSPVASSHWKCDIGMADIELLSANLDSFLKSVLKRILSPTLESGIDKICDIIVKAHEYT